MAKTPKKSVARKPARATAAAKKAGRTATRASGAAAPATAKAKPARAGAKPAVGKAAEGKATMDGAEIVRVLVELRSRLREAADQYIARVDGQLAAAVTRLASARPDAARLEGELKRLRKVKPQKGRLKDLARFEGLAEKLDELIRS